MLYGCEIWAIRVDHEKNFEMPTIQWMCGARQADRQPGNTFRLQAGVEPVSIVMRRQRLRWCGHAVRKRNTDWAKRSKDMAVKGRVLAG